MAFKSYEEELEWRRREALEAARGLYYDEDIIDRIKAAKTLGELDTALSEGRRRL